jgi:hypothetical protein
VSGVRVPPPLPTIFQGRSRPSRSTHLLPEIAGESSGGAWHRPLASAEMIGRWHRCGSPGDDTNVPLSDAACRNAKPREKPYKLTDGEGMHLLVQLNGSRLWRLSYPHGGKQKTLSFGVYPAVGLALTRERRTAARRLLAVGVDPSAASRAARRAGGVGEPTVESLAREWHANERARWVPAHAERVMSRLVRDVFPAIGRGR